MLSAINNGLEGHGSNETTNDANSFQAKKINYCGLLYLLNKNSAGIAPQSIIEKMFKIKCYEPLSQQAIIIQLKNSKQKKEIMHRKKNMKITHDVI